MKEDKLTIDLIAEYLTYNPETGIFVWIRSPARCVSENARAGHLRPDGYMQIRFKRSTFLCHRLAYFVMTGSWPPTGFEIDHKNADRADNSWENLRLATRSQNRMNSAGVKGRDLPKGVTRNIRGKPYSAGIAINGVMTHIGSFDTTDEASNAYADAARRYFGAFARAA